MAPAKNSWLRWFLGAFVLGTIIPPLFFLVLHLYILGSTIYEAAGLLTGGTQEPTVIVSNPFFELTDLSGRVVASGTFALVIASLFSGLCLGIVGLFVAIIRHSLRHSRSA